MADVLSTLGTPWEPLLEQTLQPAYPCYATLKYWLEAMGFKIGVGGRLMLPYALFGDPIFARPLVNGYHPLGIFFQDFVIAYAIQLWRGIWGTEYGAASRAILDHKILAPVSYLAFLPFSTMVREHRATGYVKGIYNSVHQALYGNRTYLEGVIPDFDWEAVEAGMLVLFDSFLRYTTLERWEWAGDLPLPDRVGPYVIQQPQCINAGISFIYRGYPEPAPAHVAHQSVDAYQARQDRVDTSFRAYVNLGGEGLHELTADIALQGNVPSTLLADTAIQADVPTSLRARLALRDESANNLLADVLLAEKHEFAFAASEIQLYPSINAVDADIAVQGNVAVPLTAKIYLEPDYVSEFKTRLERDYIQRFRIIAPPRAYVEYDSRKDPETTP